MGRQSTFDPAIADAICERLGEGEPLRVICRDDDMPAWRTVYGWLEADPAFAARFAQARARGFDAIAQECIDIADETSHDTINTEAGPKADAEWIARSKLRVETRLKLLAKWDPKRYGDKLDLNVNAPKDVRDLSTEELLALVGAERAPVEEASTDEPRKVH